MDAIWGGSKSRSQASLAGATTVQWHISSSASWGDPGSPRSSPRWKTSAEDLKTSSGGHPLALRGLACPQHQPRARPRCITPLRTAPGSQPASLCSAIFKTPKEYSHLRLLETWRVPPRYLQQPRALLIFKPAGVSFRYKTKQAN